VISRTLISHARYLLVRCYDESLFQPQPVNAPFTAFLGFEPPGEATEPAPLFPRQPANADPPPVILGLFEPPEGVTAFSPFVGGVATLVQPLNLVGGGPATPFVGGGAAAVVPANPVGGQTVITNTGCAGDGSSPSVGSGSGTGSGTITGGSTSTVPLSNAGVGFGGSSATTSNSGSPNINCNLPANVVVIVPAAIILPPPVDPPDCDG
jgi:hypothetical protein